MSQALNLLNCGLFEVPGSSRCSGIQQRGQERDTYPDVTRDTTGGNEDGWEGLVTTTQEGQSEGGQQRPQPRRQQRQDRRPLHQNRGRRKDVSRDITKSTRNMWLDASTGRCTSFLKINHTWKICTYNALILFIHWLWMKSTASNYTYMVQKAFVWLCWDCRQNICT